MDKIASPRDLQAELRRLLAYSGSHQPLRAVLATELRDLADRVAGVTASDEQDLKKWADQLKRMTLPDDYREFLHVASQFNNLAGTVAYARVKEDPSWRSEYQAVVAALKTMTKVLTDGRLNRALQDDDSTALAKLTKSVSTAASKIVAAL